MPPLATTAAACLLAVAVGTTGGAPPPEPTFSRDRVPATAAGTTSGAPRPEPTFSWDRVPVFQHLADPNATDGHAFSKERLRWLASFPLVVIEHAHGQGYMYAADSSGASFGPEPYDPGRYGAAYHEELAREAAAAIKEHNASTIVLSYQNANAALPFYRQSASITRPGMRIEAPAPAACLPAPTARGDGMLPGWTSYSWDHRQPEVRRHFIEQLINSTQGSALDGTFIDTTGCSKAGPGQTDATHATARAMQQAVPSKLVAFHCTDASPALSGHELGVAAGMDYTLAVPTTPAAAGNGDDPAPGHAPQMGAKAVAWMAANGAAGVLSLAHIGATLFSAKYNYSLAVFLAGANERSYFAFSSTCAGPLFTLAAFSRC